MRFPALKLFLVSCLIVILSWVIAPPAEALVQIKLTNISYKDCPPEMAAGAVTSGTTMAANCFLITGKANNTSGKYVYNADVFGRIYDAKGNSVMENRNRVGLIEEVPPGVSDFEFRISVAANQPTPLQLEQFKATGFTGKVRR
ncbi:hypothetical protein ACE1CI_15345 [Aerosakkonemataceae cyanobacterium BLCC-F50]|uniref:Biotin carboxylase n=1 Tax=Floridaenema flaviceps BLCC-F50 TaxID=3153642 RepID=A0ABV4XRI0_9CYAN